MWSSNKKYWRNLRKLSCLYIIIIHARTCYLGDDIQHNFYWKQSSKQWLKSDRDKQSKYCDYINHRLSSFLMHRSHFWYNRKKEAFIICLDISLYCLCWLSILSKCSVVLSFKCTSLACYSMCKPSIYPWFDLRGKSSNCYFLWICCNEHSSNVDFRTLGA